MHRGAFTELVYNVGLKKASLMQDFIAETNKLNDNNKVTLIAGYHGTDL